MNAVTRLLKVMLDTQKQGTAILRRHEEAILELGREVLALREEARRLAEMVAK